MRKKQDYIHWIVLPLLFVFAMTIHSQAQARAKNPKTKLQTAHVVITEQGYSRSSIVLRRGVPTRLTFLRQTDATCATEVMIPAYGISRSLPLNTPIAVSFTPKRSGEFNFTCGMNMMRGKLVVQ
jgi:plastocyanin domain-containing protein